MADYDVAFSLLSQDVPIAQEIQRFLPAGIRPFIYTEEQQELISARDGLIAVSDVFRQARICVVLFRGTWGQTRWTRLEHQTIRDRYMDGGSQFLVLVRLDDADVPSWVPLTDLWIHYEIEGPQRTAGYIAGRFQNCEENNSLTRVTRHTADRRPVPIARYQMQTRKNMVQYTPVRPEVCDSCTAAVEFRPIVHVTLPQKDHWPAVTEQLCPPCARARGVTVTLLPDMDRETVYAPRNPTFAEHIRRIFKYPVLPSLSRDPELREIGITQVGGGLGGNVLTLYPAGPSGSKSLEVYIHELQRQDIRSESELIDYLRQKICDAFQA